MTEEHREQQDADLMAKERLCELLHRTDVASSKLDDSDLEKLNQLSYMRWATVTFTGDQPDLRVVLKVSKGDDRSKAYGLAREGLFLQSWPQIANHASKTPEQTCELIAGFLPAVYFAEGDMRTGAKRILMEDLSECAQAGYFFGPGNCNNWGKDLEKETAGAAFHGPAGTLLGPEQITALCFSAAAKLHAGFWGCEKLLLGPGGAAGDGAADDDSGEPKLDWLRGAGWLGGQGRDSWEASQGSVQKFWDGLKEKVAAGESGVKFDPGFIELMDAAIQKTDWVAYQTELQTRPFTLTHGDFHPANFMVRPKTEEGSLSRGALALLDWEMVGVGSGPQDLGQFVISHVEPARFGGKSEEDVVRGYFDELRELNPNALAMTWEQCWSEYVQGGLGRWLWFVPVLCTFCPPKMGQFFHDQAFAFAKAHGVSKDNVPMPRA